jgi:hypothetical protein
LAALKHDRLMRDGVPLVARVMSIEKDASYARSRLLDVTIAYDHELKGTPTACRVPYRIHEASAPRSIGEEIPIVARRDSCLEFAWQNEAIVRSGTWFRWMQTSILVFLVACLFALKSRRRAKPLTPP